MGRIFDKVMNQRINSDLEELAQRIENDPLIADSDGKINMDRLHEILDEIMSDLNKKSASNIKGWDLSKEKVLAVFAENSEIKLCPFTEADREFYTAIREQYAKIAINTSLESKERAYWEGTLTHNVFFCTIMLQETNERIGYIAFKNTASNLWEIAIELHHDYCGKGFGGTAIQLFLSKAKEITGKNQYQALVEVDNIHCQKCMDKLNAELIDIFNLMFEDDEEAKRFENENMDMITEEMVQLAQKLDVEPRKLLTNVLDYRIYV